MPLPNRSRGLPSFPSPRDVPACAKRHAIVVCRYATCHVARCTPSGGSRVVALLIDPPQRCASNAPVNSIHCTRQVRQVSQRPDRGARVLRPLPVRQPRAPHSCSAATFANEQPHHCSRARWQPRTVAATCTSGRSRRNVARTPHGRRAATTRRSSRSLSCGANSRTTSASTTLRPRPWLPSGPVSCSLASHLRQDRAHSTPRLPRDGPLHLCVAQRNEGTPEYSSLRARTLYIDRASGARRVRRYDSLSGAAAWARESLEAHASDKRTFLCAPLGHRS